MLRGEWKERDDARRKEVKAEKERRSLGLEKEAEKGVEGKAEMENPGEEVDMMEALTEGLRMTSIGMVPRVVRQKQKEKEKSERMVT